MRNPYLSVEYHECCSSALLKLLCFLLLVVSGAGAQLRQTRRVLLINDLGMVSSPGFAEVDEAIFSALQNSPYQIELYHESLQLTFFGDEASRLDFRESLMRKYSQRKPDLIIAAGSASLKFVAESHETMIRDTPVVFCAVLGDISDELKSGLHVTGVLGRLQPEETLKTALHLLPGTKHVVVSGGMGKFDEDWERIARQAFQKYESQLDFTYLTDLTMPVLLERLRNLPSNTIVYHTSIAQDAAGRRFIDSAQSVPLVANASNAPVFVMDDVDLRAGTVGGSLVNWPDDGRVAGQIAARILNGERPEDIPIRRSNNVYMFDGRALKRWGLKESNLPPGSVILNREATFWESYKWYVIGGISLILLEAFLIFALLLQRARRRNAETTLAITNDRLRTAIEAGRFVGWDFNVKAGTNHWFGDLPAMFGIPSDTYSADRDEFRKRIHAEDVDTVLKVIEKAKQTREPYVAEFRVAREDGELRWIMARGKFQYSSDGIPERMLGLAVDITERKLAGQALADMSRRLIQAQEQERVRLARELHDDINQRISMLAIDLNGLGQHPPESAAGLKSCFDEMALRVSDISGELHAISHRLHSSKLEYLGLVAACKGYCKEAAEHKNVNIEFRADGIPPAVPQDVSLTIFRLLQESLQNAIKHSGAQHFTVQLRGLSGELQLIVQDDGVGFDVDRAIGNNGIGLISMRERVGLVKGSISITSEVGAGTEVQVRVPIPATSQSHQTEAKAP
jgi:signal transduction histidine kinase/ABC-type uncharacterized transport system substrate-binding protein